MDSFVHSLAAGEINALTSIVWVLAAGFLAAAAGAGSAVKLAGKDIGNELALMMGCLFGPLAALPGVVVGLIVLKLI